MLGCVIFEDEHLLVVNKPAGLNTHAPSPFAGEGIYDFLRRREPRWVNLAIIHRLDKETSGLIVFGKTVLANRSLTDRFSRRTVRKRYLLLTDRKPPLRTVIVRSSIVRAGEKYTSCPGNGQIAETQFRPADQEVISLAQSSTGGFPLEGFDSSRYCWLEAQPLTGRTHQIRVHAAEHGFPVLGDTLYGGTPAQRVYLHAFELAFQHPESGSQVEFLAPVNFGSDPSWALRQGILDPEQTNAFRLFHGATDRHPGWYVDRLGQYLLSQSERPLEPPQRHVLERLMRSCPAQGVYHKTLQRRIQQSTPGNLSPELLLGKAPPGPFTIRENGLQFELSFGEGYSVGLFLDQRENRRRLLTGYIGPGFALPLDTHIEVLNLFAYTCAFSVCAARAGARTISVDLSRKYLEWGRRNFILNGLDPADHFFLYGDVLDWLRRLARKGKSAAGGSAAISAHPKGRDWPTRFDIILLDPPTFSQSKNSGVFRAETDYPNLVRAAVPLLKLNGVLFASTNAAGFKPEQFLATIQQAIAQGHRQIQRTLYVPQPPDFPVSRAEPAYLKTAWFELSG